MPLPKTYDMKKTPPKKGTYVFAKDRELADAEAEYIEDEVDLARKRLVERYKELPYD